jgi:aryl sulfotransferase
MTPKTDPVKATLRKAQEAKDSSEKIAWPVKTRELHNHHMNSTVWNGFKFRDDDIVIATYAKSGTTWAQQIVAQLIFGGVEGLNVHAMSPWVDLRILPPPALAALDTQTHRRFVKTHLPVDALVFSPKAKYIYIGRDGRDAAWSFHNHHFNATDEYFELYNTGAIHGGPPLERGSADPHEFYTGWFNGNGFPIWPYWHHVRSWWSIRNLPNVLLIHFNDMKTDLEGSTKRIAEFLDIKVDAALLPKIVEHCTFDYMKTHAAEVAPRGGIMWKGGATTFINKGSNGRWREALSAEEIKAYEEKALAELGPECADWLAEGEMKNSL